MRGIRHAKTSVKLCCGTFRVTCFPMASPRRAHRATDQDEKALMPSISNPDLLLQALIRGLREVDPDVSAVEIADALFLAARLRKERGASPTTPLSNPEPGDRSNENRQKTSKGRLAQPIADGSTQLPSDTD